MNETLMLAVVESILFLELAGDEEIHPDVAVKQLEQLVTILNALTPAEREIFRRYVERLAVSEEAETGRTRRVDSLLSMYENLGLDDSEG